MSEKETVEVTLNIPKGLIQFLNDFRAATGFDTVKEYLEYGLVDRVRADIDGDYFRPTVKSVAEKYGLKEEFEVKD